MSEIHVYLLNFINIFFIILVTGKKYYEENIDKIKQIEGDAFKVIGFTDMLIDLIKRASIVVSRSGATTLVELMALSKICIFVPSPNVTNNHQEKNADILVKNECALKLLEKDLSVSSLVKSITKLEDNMTRIKFKNNMRKLVNYHASHDFIKEIKKLI